MTLTCPTCQTDFEAEAAVGRFPQCPHCGQTVLVDEEPDDAVAARLKDDELSALHIKATASERRALIRHRSHLIIGVILCLGAASQLLVSMVRLSLRPHAWQRPLLIDTLLFLILYLMALYLAVHLARRWYTRAGELKEQYSHSALTEPTSPPDYSALSDGSQRLRALEEMTRPSEDKDGTQMNADQHR